MVFSVSKSVLVHIPRSVPKFLTRSQKLRHPWTWAEAWPRFEMCCVSARRAERTPSGSIPNVVRVVSVAEGGVAHGIVLPGDVLLAIGDTAVGPHATHEIATAVIKAKEGVVTLKVRRGGSEQLVTFYKAAAATRTGIALES